jgi:cytochrome c-type biogenesis protein CcmH/NrfG
MASNSGSQSSAATGGWQAKQVFVMAVIFLLVGLVVGYLLPGGRAATSAKPAALASKTPGTHPPMTMEQMKAMADRKAAPLLEKLKANPKDAGALGQLGALYSSAHQFQQAAEYYNKSLQLDPKNVAVRTQLASSLYYSGDVDNATKELQQVLKSDPKNANALFNLGMMKWKGQNDAAGAIATWQELLRTNPNLDRKPTVEQAIAEAQAQQGGSK